MAKPSVCDVLLPLCAWDYAAEPNPRPSANGWNKPSKLRRRLSIARADGLEYGKDLFVRFGGAWLIVIPSMFVPPQKAELADILNQQGWTEAVIKPAFGQSGERGQSLCGGIGREHGGLSARYDCSNRISAKWKRWVKPRWCFSTAYSAMPCAVNRRKADGAPANMASGVPVLSRPSLPSVPHRAMLAALPQMPVYARVDGTLVSDTFLLNELELIEPSNT